MNMSGGPEKVIETQSWPPRGASRCPLGVLVLCGLSRGLAIATGSAECMAVKLAGFQGQESEGICITLDGDAKEMAL